MLMMIIVLMRMVMMIVQALADNDLSPIPILNMRFKKIDSSNIFF